MILNTGKQSGQMTTVLNSQIDEEITIENIEVGKCYRFTLSGEKGTEIIEGEVTYRDDKLISLCNEYYGEAEFKLNDCDKIIVECIKFEDLFNPSLDYYNNSSKEVSNKIYGKER